MEKDKETVDTIYKDEKLVAIIKLDPKTRQHVAYITIPATSEDIASMIVPFDGIKQPKVVD